MHGYTHMVPHEYMLSHMYTHTHTPVILALESWGRRIRSWRSACATERDSVCL